MHIVFLKSSLFLSGGGKAILKYASILSERGHQVSIIIPKNSIDPDMQPLISDHVSVIQSHQPLNPYPGIFGKIILAFSMLRVTPKCDVMCATHTPTTIISLIAGKLFRRGIPIWFYMDYPEMFRDRPIELFLLRNAFRWHRGMLVLSNHSKKELEALCDLMIFNIGLGLSDYETYAEQQNLPVSNKGYHQIMYLGDTRPRKGLTDLLEASELLYNQMKNIKLLIVLKDEESVSTNVPHQVITRPDTDHLARLYGESDVFVSTSWSEGFGLPPLEAMACGTPVVLTDSGGVQDFAVNGFNCLMAPIKNPAAISKAIMELLTQPELAQKLRNNGIETAKEFTWQKAVDKFEAAVNQILS